MIAIKISKHKTSHNTALAAMVYSFLLFPILVVEWWCETLFFCPSVEKPLFPVIHNTAPVLPLGDIKLTKFRMSQNIETLTPSNGQIHCEIFENEFQNIPLSLFWKITIDLSTWYTRKIKLEPMIHLDSLILQNVKSWKHLEHQYFDFRGTLEENLGAIYFTHEYFYEREDERKAKTEEQFDSGIEIIYIKFGKITNDLIQVQMELNIDFSFFNVSPLPFENLDQLPITTININTSLKINDTYFGDADLNLKTKNEAIALAQKCLLVNDYTIHEKDVLTRISLDEKVEEKRFTFTPKNKNIT